MTTYAANCINYSIGVAAMLVVVAILNKKKRLEPQSKIYGISINTALIIGYVGLGINLSLLVAVAAGWLVQRP